MPENDSFDRLLERAQGGDKAAVGELLLGSHDPLTQYLARRMPVRYQHVLDVDDVLQETFAVAFRDIGKCERMSEASFLAWLRTVAEHRLQDEIKRLESKKRGGKARRVTLAVATSDAIAELIQIVAGNDPTASNLARSDEARQALVVAVSALPEDQRLAIQMRYLEGKDVEEVAQELGRTPGAVRALSDRARNKLRGLIGSLSHYMSSR